jgi:hypothetical protein
MFVEVTLADGDKPLEVLADNKANAVRLIEARYPGAELGPMRPNGEQDVLDGGRPVAKLHNPNRCEYHLETYDCGEHDGECYGGCSCCGESPAHLSPKLAASIGRGMACGFQASENGGQTPKTCQGARRGAPW